MQPQYILNIPREIDSLKCDWEIFSGRKKILSPKGMISRYSRHDLAGQRQKDIIDVDPDAPFNIS
jgi:selenocysteine lyase/cysteine desulfurase